MLFNVGYKWLKTPNGLLKIFELLLEVTCLILLVNYELFGINEHTVYMTLTMNGGIILVTSTFILLYLFDDLQGKTGIGEMIVHLISSIFFIAHAGVSMSFCVQMRFICEETATYTYSALNIVVAVLFIVDAVFAYRNTITAPGKKASPTQKNAPGKKASPTRKNQKSKK